MSEKPKFFGSATSGTQKPLTTPKEETPTPPKESPPMDQETIFKESIPRLIEIVETLNPPEKVKIIGKLRGALELFNSTN